MPLEIQRNINPYTTLAIWKITEPIEELAEQARKPANVILTNTSKQLQRASVQLILKNIFFNTQPVLEHDKYGKPCLLNSTFQISISHTTAYAAVIVSEKYPAGIDIEHIHSRIEKVKTKFMSEHELQNIKTGNEIEQLYVYWCAKEALYKYYGKKELIFKEQLLIDPFPYSGNGDIRGHIITESFVKTLHLHYEKFNDHMLVYVAE